MLLNKLKSDKKIACVSRPPSSASATGIMRQHEYEKEKMFEALFKYKHDQILLTPSLQ